MMHNLLPNPAPHLLRQPYNPTGVSLGLVCAGQHPSYRRRSEAKGDVQPV